MTWTPYPRLRPLRSGLLAVSWLAAMAPPTWAQSTPPKDPVPQDPVAAPVAPVGELLRELRHPKLTLERRDEIVGLMLDAGPNGAGQLFHFAGTKYGQLHKKFEAARRGHLRAFQGAAPAVLAERQGRGAAVEIQELREKVLAHSRGNAGLDKTVIRTVLDPAMARLAELLEISASDVLMARPELAAEARALDEQILELLEWQHIHDIAGDELALTDRGARKVEKVELPDPTAYRRELAAARDLLARSATPMGARDAKVLERNAELGAELEPEEYEGIRQLNRLRLHLGLNALAIDLKLCEAGRGHSEDMVRLRFFAHESPVPGKESPGKRAALAGTSGGAENIAAGQSSGAGAIRAWWYSPGHHRNMLGGHGRVGLGRCESHWTQMFGG